MNSLAEKIVDTIDSSFSATPAQKREVEGLRDDLAALFDSVGYCERCAGRGYDGEDYCSCARGDSLRSWVETFHA